MAAFGNLTLKNHAGTDVIFKPASRNGNVVEWMDDSSGVVASYRKVTMQVIRPTATKAGRVEVRIQCPVLVTPTPPTGIPVVAWSDFCRSEYVLPPGSLLPGRQDLLAFAKSSLIAPQVVDAVLSAMGPT